MAPSLSCLPEGTQTMSSQRDRWAELTGGQAGEDYARRFARLAASGHDIHGEAAFCDALLKPAARVLDAGCGTGRIAIRLAELGHLCTGVDVDPSMLAVARRDAPTQEWLHGDLAHLDTLNLEPGFDLALAAGNVIPLLAPGTEPAVVRQLAAVLRSRRTADHRHGTGRGTPALAGTDSDADGVRPLVRGGRTDAAAALRYLDRRPLPSRRRLRRQRAFPSHRLSAAPPPPRTTPRGYQGEGSIAGERSSRVLRTAADRLGIQMRSAWRYLEVAALAARLADNSEVEDRHWSRDVISTPARHPPVGFTGPCRCRP